MKCYFLLQFQCKKELLVSITSDGNTQQQQCPHLLPFEEQGWPSHMGILGDSRYNPKAEMKWRDIKDSKSGKR